MSSKKLSLTYLQAKKKFAYNPKSEKISVGLFHYAFNKYIKIFLQVIKKRRVIAIYCVRDGPEVSGKILCVF